MTKVSRGWFAAAACAVLVSAAPLCSCSAPVDQKAEVRRDVLRANNLAADRRKQHEATRITDEHGKLLPSQQRVAGVVLPRGYQPKFTFDYEWQFDGEQPYSKLATYFTEQLDFSGVTRPNGGMVTFTDARTKGDSQMKTVRVTISPVPGRDDWSRIRIVAQRPMPERRQSKAEIEAELSMRRQNMH